MMVFVVFRRKIRFVLLYFSARRLKALKYILPSAFSSATLNPFRQAKNTAPFLAVKEIKMIKWNAL